MLRSSEGLMWDYLQAHWRGEHSVARSCLLNGVVVGFVGMIGTVIVGILLTKAAVYYCAVSHGQFCREDNSALYFAAYVKNPLIWLLRLLWAVWACVGMLRCGWRVRAARAGTKGPMIAGLAAMAGGLVVAAWVGAVVVFFVNDERHFAELKPCLVDLHSAPCKAHLAAMHSAS
jgi:hypothetical protein